MTLEDDPIAASFEVRTIPGEAVRFTEREHRILWSLYMHMSLRNAATPHHVMRKVIWRDTPEEDMPLYPDIIMRIMMTRLRKKLKVHQVVNVRGIGYKLERINL